MRSRDGITNVVQGKFVEWIKRKREMGRYVYLVGCCWLEGDERCRMRWKGA